MVNAIGRVTAIPSRTAITTRREIYAIFVNPDPHVPAIGRIQLVIPAGDVTTGPTGRTAVLAHILAYRLLRPAFRRSYQAMIRPIVHQVHELVIITFTIVVNSMPLDVVGPTIGPIFVPQGNPRSSVDNRHSVQQC